MFLLMWEREWHLNMREKYWHRSVASRIRPTGDRTCNPGMCPDQKSNLQPFPNLFSPIFLVKRSSSRVVKFINPFLYGQYFCVSFMKSLHIPNSIFSNPLKCLIALLFTVSSMALQAIHYLRYLWAPVCSKEHNHSSLCLHMPHSGIILYCYWVSIQISQFSLRNRRWGFKYFNRKSKTRGLTFSTDSWICKAIIHLFIILQWTGKLPFMLPQQCFQESCIDVLF